MAVQARLPLQIDDETVTLPREVADRVLVELQRVLSTTGHRLQVLDWENRGHCPSAGGGHCAPGCVAFTDLLCDLMDALGVPEPRPMPVSLAERRRARREGRS